LVFPKQTSHENNNTTTTINQSTTTTYYESITSPYRNQKGTNTVLTKLCGVVEDGSGVRALLGFDDYGADADAVNGDGIAGVYGR